MMFAFCWMTLQLFMEDENMGTLRDEMTKVLNEWDKQDEVISQPTQEKPMTTERVTAT